MKTFYKPLARLAAVLVLAGVVPEAYALPTDTLQYKNLGSVVNYYHRGNDRFNTGDYRGAIADYDQVVRLNPTISCVYLNRAYARQRLGDARGAAADSQLFRKFSLLSDDTNFCTFLNRGHALRVAH